jgi:hypothetical protein
MDKHTKQQIKKMLQDKHRILCYEYKNVISLEEVNLKYATIHYWWYSLGATNEVGLQELENWLCFLYFCVKQWRAFMIHVLFSTLPHIFSFTPYF